MARAIATIGGTALVPGVSKNRRWYTRELIAGAVAKAQERIADGTLPLTVLTHHGAEDDSTRLVGRVTSVTLAEDGSARFTAEIADTEHGRTVANLMDTSDGKPAFLGTVSMRGAWEGRVRRIPGPDGRPAEQGDGLTWNGFDLTKDPGVPQARLDAFAWASEGQQETTEQVLITESVQEARLTITEEAAVDSTAATGAGVLEALGILLGAGDPGLLEAETPAISKRKSGLAGSGRVYADPGYQSDHKQRYDITDKGHAVTAWRYISQKAKAAKYTASQLKNIKSRIRAALKKFGVSVSTEASFAGWTFETYQVTAEVAELYGDPSRAGSWCINASNGPVNLSLSSWAMDPADLDVILRAAAGAACDALAALDPDMDGDVDVDGVGVNSDPDGDAGHESAPDPDEPAQPGEGPAPAGTQEGMEAPAMGEDTTSTTQPGGNAPAAGLSTEALAAIGAAVAEGLKSVLPAPPAPAAPAAPAEPAATETQPASVAAAVAETLKALGVVPGATQTPPPATETAPAATPQAVDPAIVKAAVSEALSGLGIKPPEPKATETAPDLGSQVKAMVTEAVQGLVASGQVTPQREGLAGVTNGWTTEHAVPTGSDGKEKDPAALRALSDDDFVDYGGAALDNYTFGGRGKALHGTDGGLA